MSEATQVLETAPSEPVKRCLCGETPVRLWPVPDDQQAVYGATVAFCELCELFVGEPVTDWLSS